MITCGDTAIFYEDGLLPDYNFSLEQIYSEGSLAITETTLLSGLVNSA